MVNYIDLEGLSTNPQLSLDILKLKGEVIGKDSRMACLASATKAGNVSFVTGAIGATFWSIAHPSAFISYQKT